MEKMAREIRQLHLGSLMSVSPVSEYGHPLFAGSGIILVLFKKTGI